MNWDLSGAAAMSISLAGSAAFLGDATAACLGLLALLGLLGLLGFLSSSSESELEDDEDEEEDEEEEESDESDDDDESESESESTSCCCCMIIFGAFLRCSLSISVKPPRPIEVKKLIANRVLRGLSRGNRPVK